MEERKEGGNREGKGGGGGAGRGRGKKRGEQERGWKMEWEWKLPRGSENTFSHFTIHKERLLTHSLTYSTYDRTKQNTNELPNQPTRANEIEENSSKA